MFDLEYVSGVRPGIAFHAKLEPHLEILARHNDKGLIHITNLLFEIKLSWLKLGPLHLARTGSSSP